VALPAAVKIVEVGPRDGLQNESGSIDVETRVQLVNMLAEAGLPIVETGSFVNPKWVPQMASSEAVFSAIERRPGTRYAALTPNLKGFERALAAGADEIAVFAAASEGFSQKNINCSIAESLARFEPVMVAAADAGLPVRGYVSCVVGCPYDGEIPPMQVLTVCRDLLAMGCYEVSLGDTIGVGTAGSIASLLDALLAEIPADQLALHCHDTYGQALANILTGLQLGIATIDSSVAGLGGCPYAHGATGNVATEDVLYLLEGLGIRTGVDAEKLRAAGNYISARLNRPTQSRVARALAPAET
jgi:hydroxymethylglutaryl-CoA lyase